MIPSILIDNQATTTLEDIRGGLLYLVSETSIFVCLDSYLEDDGDLENGSYNPYKPYNNPSYPHLGP